MKAKKTASSHVQNLGSLLSTVSDRKDTVVDTLKRRIAAEKYITLNADSRLQLFK